MEVHDDTAEYRATLVRWVDTFERNEVALRHVMGAEMCEERRQARQGSLAAIGDGLLGRFRYLAIR